MSEAKEFPHVIKVSCEIVEEYTQNGFTVQMLKGYHVHSVVVRDASDDVVSWETFSGPLAGTQAYRVYSRTLGDTANARM
jgi:hypothetical protein